MTAQVLTHPALLGHLIEEKREELTDAENWCGWLYDGTKLAGERFPELAGIYGGQDIAVEQADLIAADLRRELAALEARVPA